MLSPGTKVKLITFNNSSVAPEGCDPSENYWALIGELGIIIEPKNSRSRLLVQFDNSVELMGLHCHNKIKNSLLILASDLEVINVGN